MDCNPEMPLDKQVPWDELPISLLQHVFHFLDIRQANSLSSLQLACRCWRNTALSLVATQASLELSFNNPDHILTFCKWYERYCLNAKKLRVNWHPWRVPLKLRCYFWQQLFTTPSSANLTHITSGSTISCVHSPHDYTDSGYCSSLLSALTARPEHQIIELDVLQEWQCNSDWGLASGGLVNLSSSLTRLRSLHIKLEWQKPCDEDLVLALPCLTHLTSLSLRDTFISDPNCLPHAFTPLAPTLNSLTLSLKGCWLNTNSTNGDQALGHLACLTRLTSLTLHDWTITDQAPVQTLPASLLELELVPYSSICYGFGVVSGIAKGLTQLKSLRLGERGWLPMQAVQCIGGMTQLTRLQLPPCGAAPLSAAATAAAAPPAAAAAATPGAAAVVDDGVGSSTGQHSGFNSSSVTPFDMGAGNWEGSSETAAAAAVREAAVSAAVAAARAAGTSMAARGLGKGAAGETVTGDIEGLGLDKAEMMATTTARATAAIAAATPSAGGAATPSAAASATSSGVDAATPLAGGAAATIMFGPATAAAREAGSAYPLHLGGTTFSSTSSSTSSPSSSSSSSFTAVSAAAAAAVGTGAGQEESRAARAAGPPPAAAAATAKISAAATTPGAGEGTTSSPPPPAAAAAPPAAPVPLVPQLLSGLTKLKDLHLHQHMAQGLGDSGLAGLTTLTALTALRVPYGGLTGAAVPHLLQLPQLQLLDISANSVGSSGVSELAHGGLRRLQQLRVSYVGLRGASALEAVAQQLQQLTYLDVSSNAGVTAEGFAALGGLPGLRVLVTSPPVVYEGRVGSVLRQLEKRARVPGFLLSWA